MTTSIVKPANHSLHGIDGDRSDDNIQLLLQR